MNTRYLVWFFFSLLMPFSLVLFLIDFLFLSFLSFLLGLIAFIFGFIDFTQKQTSVLRNYPLTARIRFFLESFRPEIRQYFVESDDEQVPFSRNQRSLVYRRAKLIGGSRPFGSIIDMSESGHEWLNHSIIPSILKSHDFRVLVGKERCKKAYNSSVLNISGMSFGALSPQAIFALNSGAKKGSFAHTTGEGGVSDYHVQNGGDLIWQIGSGYFGCRDKNGKFDKKMFKEQASIDQVKMIEIKLSQGAKPGHGGILPGAKVNAEIAKARGVEIGKDCISPSSHSAFNTPSELIEFIENLREWSNGKPIGIKMCIGHPWEWFGIAKAMRKFKNGPDFITIDGSEGGTGAAPSEFLDHIGAPLQDGLMLVQNTLVGLGIRDQVKLIASGKLISAHDLARTSSIGADVCNMARGFMFSLGCIQALSCHNGKCPTGITTQDKSRSRALVVSDKSERVFNFHDSTLRALKEIVESAGIDHPNKFQPEHLVIRKDGKQLGSALTIFPWLNNKDLLKKSSHKDHPAFEKFWDKSSEETFVYRS